MLSPELKQQVRSISAVVLILGAAELAVSLILSLIWDISFLKALAGDVLGCLCAILNFYLLAKSVEKSLSKDVKGAQAHMSLTYMGRLLLTAAVVIIAIKLPRIFNLWAAVIPLIFPRVAIMLTNLKSKNKGGENS
ncbi:MAG: ATP synthase subunit I [Clostridia bacterium]